MDVHDKLDEITQVVQEARAMPMSASALVNRAELLDLLADLRHLIPEELHHADLVLSDREAVVAEGRAEAERLVQAAREESARLVEETEVVQRAQRRAEQVRAEAEAESTRLLTQADDYVDRKLAEFEILLDRLQQQVGKGRTRLAERRAADLDDLPHAGLDDEPDPVLDRGGA